MRGASLRALVPIALGGSLLAIYLWVELALLPTAQGLWAADYALHFPNLLVGVYWRLNNGFAAAPWFDPALCGGVPYHADPNVAFYAAPQFLAFVMPIGDAIRATMAMFAAAGFFGAYGLMRRSFGASQAGAATCAGLFLFNGFFAARMLAGHLTFHAFMLAPVLAWAALPDGDSAPRGWASIFARGGVAALALAYMFQSGMVHGIPPVALSIAILAVMHALIFGVDWRPAAILALGALGALALSASKLSAEMAWLAQFPRSLYPLPGIADPLMATFAAPLTLLGYAPEKSAWLVNTDWLQDRHEWEYGVSVAPFVLFLVALVVFIRRADAGHFAPGRIGGTLLLLALLAIPSVLNVYTPSWNAILKSLPYLSSSSSLLRFFSANILPACVGAGLAVDWVASSTRWRAALSAGALAIMLVQFFMTSRAYYADVDYDPSRLEAASAAARAGGVVPTVTRVEDDGGGPADGASRASCYQPLFGYRLEAFPRGALQAGPIDPPSGATLNLKNPACYVFPAENACSPGDQFSRSDLALALYFAAYRPFDFSRSARQEFADAVNLAAVTLFAIGTLAFAGAWVKRRLTDGQKAAT